MELRQLRQFLALAEHRNFHRAAASLNISQPPLTVSMRKLEEELGVRLIDRHARGISLTPDGELTLPQAREIVRLADEIKISAKEATSGARGLLSLGFVASATYSLVPALVPAFRNRFPAVELKLREATSAEIVAGLKQGELDGGLIRTPIYGVPGISLTPVGIDRLIAAVPRGHRLESRAEIDLEEMDGEPIIAWSRTAEPWVRTLIDLSFSSIGIVPAIIEEASQIHTLIALVECGLGAGIVPSIVRRAGLGRVRLVDLLCKGAPIEIGFAIAVREGEARQLTSNFSAIAAQTLSDIGHD